MRNFIKAAVGSWIGRFNTFPDRFRRKVSQGEYRAEIDGLRFFAIAFVIFGHTLERAVRFYPDFAATIAGSLVEPFLQLAPPGVLLFFTISGFVITTQAMTARVSPLSAGFLKSYFGRRVLRIEPPYIVLLVVTWALLSLTHWSPEGVHRFDVEPRSLNVSLLASVFYLHDLLWNSFPRLFPPGWSLEVEVQFYILAPFLFALWALQSGARNRTALALLGLTIGLAVSLLKLKWIGSLSVEYSLLRYFSYFWLGAAMAQFREALAQRLTSAPKIVATALGFGGMAAFVLTEAPGEQMGIALEAARLVAAYASLAAIFASTFDARSGFRRFCARPWISLIGGACYSIYLVHLQIVQVTFIVASKVAPHIPFVAMAGLFALSASAVCGVGLVYYVQIERRFMARDWPQAALAAVRRKRMAKAPPHLVVDNAAEAPAVTDARAALKRRSAATRP